MRAAILLLGLMLAAPPARADDVLLALSWQAAFCETRPDRPECERPMEQTARFTLHGLWPQPRDNTYCGVSRRDRENDERGRWSRLPEPDLSNDTRAEMVIAMPGARSNLHRHQWIKHGTCWGGSAEDYFRRAIALLEAVNASPLAELFDERIGERITRREAERALGGARRIRFSCQTDRDSGRKMVTAVRIALDDDEEDFDDALRYGRRLGGGCGDGLVDPHGLQ